MVDDDELELNVLEFTSKSFSFERAVMVEGTELAVFHRTETESESRFRPKVIRLRLVVPKAWVLYDLAADMLRLARDGTTPWPGAVGSAVEAAAQSSRFEEGGIAWRRVPTPGGGFLYAPEEWAERLFTPARLRQFEEPAGPG